MAIYWYYNSTSSKKLKWKMKRETKNEEEFKDIVSKIKDKLGSEVKKM